MHVTILIVNVNKYLLEVAEYYLIDELMFCRCICWDFLAEKDFEEIADSFEGWKLFCLNEYCTQF
jgi:hypothetical protein